MYTCFNISTCNTHVEGVSRYATLEQHHFVFSPECEYYTGSFVTLLLQRPRADQNTRHSETYNFTQCTPVPIGNDGHDAPRPILKSPLSLRCTDPTDRLQYWQQAGLASDCCDTCEIRTWNLFPDVSIIRPEMIQISCNKVHARRALGVIKLYIIFTPFNLVE